VQVFYWSARARTTIRAEKVTGADADRELPWIAEIAIIGAHLSADPITTGGLRRFQRALPVSDGTIRQQES
jgi:hypothetical protein